MLSSKLLEGGGGGVSLPILLAGVWLRFLEAGVYSLAANIFFVPLVAGVFPADRAKGEDCCPAMSAAFEGGENSRLNVSIF